ncbi:Exportin-6, partial [Podila humilis]
MDALELLLAEFFGHGTSMDRKRTIETQLESQQLSFDDCRYLLTHARSDYAAWFAASQFQKRIQTEWSRLSPQLQYAHRTFLLQFLQQRFGSGTTTTSNGGLHGSSGLAMGIISGTSPPPEAASSGRLSSFVANKVIQLVSVIALLDWPDRYQELFSDIHQFIQSSNKDHALLGWTLLEAVIQEFVSTYPAPGVGKSQRVHLVLAQQRRLVWEHFKAQVPALLALIVQHLDACYTKTLVAPLSTEAPAPSPVEHSVWGSGSIGRRPSVAAAQSSSPLMFGNNTLQNSFSGSRAVPGSMNNSFASLNPSTSSYIGHSLFPGDPSAGAAHSFGKSPTTMLRKSLSSALGGTLGDHHGHHSTQSPMSGSGFLLLQSRQRMGSISSIGQIAMRRSSINAAAYTEGRRGSVEQTFVTGNKMDSHTRKTCLLALKALTTLLSCPGLDPRQVSFSVSLTTVLKFSTLHQAKTVDLGILALSCLNGLVARPGFLASNQEVMTSAVRLMADLIRYFNEVRDGIDDIDESYLQMFMHFVTLFCTLVHLERAERELGLSISDFLFSFARFTLEKISIDNLKICMDVWKSLLDIIVHSAAEIPRPIPMHHRLRRVQEPVLYFMSSLVEKVYKMKEATRSEDAFSTFEVEDEEDLEELTDLVEGFVGQVGEVYMEEVIEMLNPLLQQQMDLFSRREFDECKTLPVTLGIFSKVAYNLVQNFEIGREYTSNLMIHLTRMTKLSTEFYLSTVGDASSPGKDEISQPGNITLALLHSLLPLIPWLHQYWRFESDRAAQSPGSETQIAQEIYQELVQIAGHLFRALLPSSVFNAPANSLQSTFSGRDANTLGTFLGPATAACSPTDRKLLVASVKVLGTLTVQVRPPPMATHFSFWDLESTQLVATCLSQSVMANSHFMGLEFPPQSNTADNDLGSEDEDREGVTPTDNIYRNAYVALSNGIIMDTITGQEQGALQSFGNLLAAVVYPLQKILQDSRTVQGAFANAEVKFSVHRSLTVLKAIVLSCRDTSALSRTVAFEGLKSVLPLIQEYFEIYKEDHDLSMDIMRFFKSLVTSLFHQIGNGYCLGIARVLMDRFSTPPILETALAPIMSGNGMLSVSNGLYNSNCLQHQRSHVIQQQKLRGQLRESVVILKSILELPGRDITKVLPEFSRFLFGELGPQLMQVSSVQRPTATSATATASGSPSSYSLAEERLRSEQLEKQENGGDMDSGAFELMILYFSTVQTLLTHHARYFFADTRVRPSPLSVTQSNAIAVSTNSNLAPHDRLLALQSCLEFLARGLHRPEPDIVRKVIEVLEALQEHPQCRLFDRNEFQQTFRFEFLQILFRMALQHQQDLLLEDMARLIHRLVKGPQGVSSSDEKFVQVWQTDLKRFVAGLEPCHVLTDLEISAQKRRATSSPTQALPGVGGSLGGEGSDVTISTTTAAAHGTGSLIGLSFPDTIKEALWKDLARLGDESRYSEALYDFVNDAQVYAQNMSPAGYALFNLLDDGKLEKPDSIWKDFETPEQANKT